MYILDAAIFAAQALVAAVGIVEVELQARLGAEQALRQHVAGIGGQRRGGGRIAHVHAIAVVQEARAQKLPCEIPLVHLAPGTWAELRHTRSERSGRAGNVVFIRIVYRQAVVKFIDPAVGKQAEAAPSLVDGIEHWPLRTGHIEREQRKRGEAALARNAIVGVQAAAEAEVLVDLVVYHGIVHVKQRLFTRPCAFARRPARNSTLRIDTELR
nr:hypothetical protein [Tanacetum cinerariifolium]